MTGKLKLFRFAGANLYTTLAQSAQQGIAPNTLNSFPTRIPVQGGEVVGATFQGAGSGCLFAVPGTANRMRNQSNDPAPGTTQAYNVAIARANVAASLEPDADRDNFGDETQDGCPTNASTQLACPATGQRARARRTCSAGTARTSDGSAAGPPRRSCAGATAGPTGARGRHVRASTLSPGR